MREPERSAAVQLLFRDVNERIRAVGAELFDLTAEDEVTIVCECLRTGCSERIRIGGDIYARVREQPERFLVVSGHEDARVERVVERNGRYLVVEKDAAVVGRVRADDDRQPAGLL